MLPPMNVPIVHNEYHPTILGWTIIDNNTDNSIANIFCFGAFADCQSGVVYNNLTGNFLYHVLGWQRLLSCGVPLQV
jgi:hypothetical protein